MRRALPLLLVLLGAAPFAHGKERVRYGPVPKELAAVVAEERDSALARSALAAIERGAGDTNAPRSLLVLLDEVGLKAVAERLAGTPPTPRVLADLIAVVAASRHPEADVLLERAADEARPELRMIAADGLGRGRTARAVPVLTKLARDGVPGVRIAALRSLFAIDTPQAVAARIAVPADSEAELLARRLRWHRRCEDVAEELRAIAHKAYLHRRSVPLRIAAAEYLALPDVKTPAPLLELIVRELGQGPFIPAAVRIVRRLPREGYYSVDERRIAIQALLTLLARPDLSAEDRTRWIDQAVAWVAHPVAMDPYRRDPIPGHVLRRRLPDLGAAIVEPVVRRLARGGFADPRVGVILLRELGPDLALPPLRAFLQPRTEVPAFESRAEAMQRRYLRSQAAGAVQELGRIGDEQLATALLMGDEERPLKIDILYALRKEEGPWVVPLLARVKDGKDKELRSHAITLLEERPEPEARKLLIADLFERMQRPHDRLRPLVRKGDEPSYEVLKRALGDKRSYMRKAALSQFNRRRNPRLSGATARAVLAEHAPAADSPQEIQDYVYALLNVDPEAAVAWVRKRWDALPDDGMRMTTLRILGETIGKTAREAAIDLAIEKAAGDVPKSMKIAASAVFMGPREATTPYGYDWTYRAKDVGAFYRALLFDADAQLQREAIHAYAHKKAPDEHARLLELLAKALAGKALPERMTSPVGEQSFARDVIDALPFQPWERVESTLIDVALDPLGEDNTRLRAAHMLVGRLTDAGRTRLLAWLDYTPPPGPQPDPNRKRAPGYYAKIGVQLFLAAAIGQGADARVAGMLYQALRRELFAFYTPERLTELLKGTSDAAAGESQLLTRAVPLARGISHTKHVASILALLDLVFDLRFALYARVCADAQAQFARAAGAGAAARTPSKLKHLVHDDETPYWGMPTALHDILYELKKLDDDVLANGFRKVLEKARRDGRLAHFPPLFMYRVQLNLLEPRTGRKPKTVAAVVEYASRMGEPDGPIHLKLFKIHASELADNGSFALAAEAQRHATRIVARGSYDDREPGLWLQENAVLGALEGAAAAVRGEQERAASRFLATVLRAPNDPGVLNTVAWYASEAGFTRDQIEGWARRAVLLQTRLEHRLGLNATDTFAYVLLRRGKPREGLRALGPRMGERGAWDNGLLHYHMAQMYAAVRAWRSARDALKEALVHDRHLEHKAKGEPLFKPLFEKQSLEAIRNLAAEQRLAEDLSS